MHLFAPSAVIGNDQHLSLRERNRRQAETVHVGKSSLIVPL